MNSFELLKRKIIKKQQNFAKKIHGEELAEEKGKEHEPDHGVQNYHKEIMDLLDNYEKQIEETPIKKSQWFPLARSI